MSTSVAVGRRARRDRSSSSNGTLFKHIRMAKAETHAYYLYRIFEAVNSSDSDCNGMIEYFQDFFYDIIDDLGRRKHAEKVFEAIIAHHVKHRRLTPVADDSGNSDQAFDESSFDYSGKLDKYYKEDNRLIPRSLSGYVRTSTRFDVQFARAMFAGSKPDRVRLIKLVLFADPSDPICVSSRVSVPKTFRDKACDLTDVRFLMDAFGLSESEGAVLQCAFNIKGSSHAYCFFRHALDDHSTTREDNINRFSIMTGISYLKISEMVQPSGKLIFYGFMDEDGDIEDDIREVIMKKDFNCMFRSIVEADDMRKRCYPVETFQVKREDTELVEKLLRSPNPVSILLYGPPGNGKTEYARSLVRQCGLNSLVYRNSVEVSEGGWDRDGSGMGKALKKLRRLLSVRQEDSVVIVDEAENALNTASGLFDSGSVSCRKGLVNRMFDASVNKSIWILNYGDGVDRSTFRRFTFSIAFDNYTEDYSKKVARSRLNEVRGMSSRLKEKISELAGKYQITGASLDNMIKTVQAIRASDRGGCCSRGSFSENSDDRILADAERVFRANSELVFGRRFSKRRKCSSGYDLSVLNTSFPVDRMMTMMRNALAAKREGRCEDSGIRMLFYGLTGAGKTELVRYMGEQLDMKVIAKRCSDILSPFVGVAEQNIGAAFREAEESGGILLFDEADSFLSDRSGASYGWERTQTNEFLTQMEEFGGILVCTTNLRRILDPAVARRFHFLVEFNAMDENGIRTLLGRYYPNLSFSSDQISRIIAFDSVTPGDFGALSGSTRFISPGELDGEYVIRELVRMQEEKQENGCGTRKLGF